LLTVAVIDELNPCLLDYCCALYDYVTVNYFCLLLLLTGAGAVVTDEDPGVISYCYALYDYVAVEPNQLSLRRGDRVAVTSKAGASRGWWKGRLHGKVIH